MSNICLSLKKEKCHIPVGNFLGYPCDVCGEFQRGDCVGIGRYESIFEGSISEEDEVTLVKIIKKYKK